MGKDLGLPNLGRVRGFAGAGVRRFGDRRFGGSACAAVGVARFSVACAWQLVQQLLEHYVEEAAGGATSSSSRGTMGPHMEDR